MAGENDDKDKLWIKLHLYDTDMSVSINRNSGEEEFYRKAAKLITDLVNIYASRFKTKSSNKHYHSQYYGTLRRDR